MGDRSASWGTGRIALLVLLVVIVGGIGVVFVMKTMDDAGQERGRARYAGTWVREGSNGDDYFELGADGTYSVHVGGYTGSIKDEKWGARDGRIFIPTEVKLTVGGPGSGNETVYGVYLHVEGDRLVVSEGAWKGTFQRK